MSEGQVNKNTANYNSDVEEGKEPVTFIIKFTPEENLEKRNKCARILKIIAFYFIGISCLVPLGAILSGLDSFIFYHKDYYPEFVYPNLYSVSNFLLQFPILILKPKFSYYRLIQISLSTMMVIYCVMPLIVIYLSEFTSFIVSSGVILLIGGASATLQACLYSFLIYLDKVFITSVVTGHGLAGIIVNLSRLITILIFRDDDEQTLNSEDLNKSFFIFNYLSAALMLLNIFIWLRLKNELDVRKALKKIQPFQVMFDEDVNFEERCLSLCSLKTDEGASINIDIKKPSELEKMKNVLKFQSGINFTLFFHQLITFSIYPGIIIKNMIFTSNKHLSVMYILLIFNFFDILGRQIPKFMHFSKLCYLYSIVILRTLFIFIFIYFHKMRNIEKRHNFNFYYDDYAILTTLGVFAFTNGFIITNSFIFIHNDDDSKINENLKGKTSGVLNASLLCGVLFGSTLAYLVNFLILNNK
jgi:hypothetical protein